MRSMLVVLMLVANVYGWGQMGQPIFLTQSMSSLRAYSDIDLDGDLDIFMDYVGWAERDDQGRHHQRWIFSDQDSFIWKDIVDMDNDGDDDVFGWLFGTIGWYENDNSHNLWEWNPLLSGNLPWLRDVDNDGVSDIIYEVDNSLWVAHINEGNLNFSNAISLTDNQVEIAFSIRVDFDGDGILDGIRSGDCEGGICLTYYLSSTGFDPIVTDPVDPSTICYVGDIDGDLAADVLLKTSSGYTQIYIISNPVINGFDNLVLISDTEFFAPEFLDFDLDGDVDAMAIDQDDYLGTVLELNDGFGNFEEQDIITLPFDIVFTPNEALLGDPDADGDYDVQTQGFNLEYVGDYVYQIVEPNDYILGMPHIELDVNGDGKMELLSYWMNILYFNEDGQVGEIVQMPALPYNGNFFQDWSMYFVQDYNYDGRDDLLLIGVGSGYYGSGGGAVLLVSNGIGYDVASQLFYENEEFTDNSEFADMDGNGLTDFVYANLDGSIEAIFIENDFTISEATELCSFSDYVDLRIFDVNFDGYKDVLSWYDGNEMFINNGDGSYATILNTPFEELSFAFEEFDIDLTGDGILDISSGGTFLSESNGFQIVNTVINDVAYSGILVWLNLNGDPLVDFVVLQNSEDDDMTNNMLECYLNQGDLVFQHVSSTLLESSYKLFPVRGLDTNGDGLDELLWTTLYDFEVMCCGEIDYMLDYVFGKDQFFISENLFESELVISGQIFNDLNHDGLWSIGETGIGNSLVSLDSEGIFQSATNSYMWYVAEGNHEVSISYDDEVWVPITPTVYSVDVSEDSSGLENLNFGFVPLSDEATIDLQVEAVQATCGSSQAIYLQVLNIGGYTSDVQLTLELDSLLLFQEASIAPDSSWDNQTLFWHFESLPFGTSATLVVYVAYPDVNNVGQVMLTQAIACAISEEGEVTMCDVELIDEVVLCSYDPNYIEVTPTGWSDSGFVLADTELEYTIHFQNLGNAPAQNVRVEDLLPASLDWSTLQLTAWSHEISELTVDESGLMKAYFNNIMLPDSTNDEPNSHGFFTFKLQILPGMPALTEIENTAEIYFDFNEPVVTNTVLNTIFDCAAMTSMTCPDAEFCEGESFACYPEVQFAEYYHWYINGEEVMELGEPWNEPYIEIYPVEPSINEISLVAGNPLCEIEIVYPLVVHPKPPVPSFTQVGNTITASGSGTFNWFFNGQLQEGISGNTFTIPSTGWVKVFVVDEFGCASYLTEGLGSYFIYVGIEELAMEAMVIIPNPVTDQFTITFPQSQITNHPSPIIIYDLLGNEVLRISNVYSGMKVNVQDWSDGVYMVRFSAFPDAPVKLMKS